MIAAIKALLSALSRRKQAVTLPALHIVNERLRYVPLAGGGRDRRAAGARAGRGARHAVVLRLLQAGPPHGQTRAWVCRSISCALRGGEEVLDHLCHAAGIEPGETTPDGKLTLEFAECLGACEFAPCMLAGDTDESAQRNLTTSRSRRRRR